MARSEYIYVVERPGEPPAAFTVKHELIHWLALQPPALLPFLVIWRCRDSLHKRPPSQITMAELGLQPPPGTHPCQFCGKGLVVNLRHRCRWCAVSLPEIAQ
jgi:hypothetical protein